MVSSRNRAAPAAFVSLAAAAAAVWCADTASAAPESRAPRLLDERVHARPIDPERGPVFALRCHSMDVRGESADVGCFEYACRDLVTGAPQKYDLVRTVTRGAAAGTDCDEVLSLLPIDAPIVAVMGQTRWMRRDGPAQTPFGAFLGDLYLAHDRGGEADLRKHVFLSFKLAGTTGLRPMRGNAADATLLDEDRCRAPRHDEGWYIGNWNRDVLRALARRAEASDAEGAERLFRILRTLDRSVLMGTFEGRLAIEPTAESRFDYCEAAGGSWWFDGVMGYECPDAVRPSPDADPATESGAAVRVRGEIEVGVR